MMSGIAISMLQKPPLIGFELAIFAYRTRGSNPLQYCLRARNGGAGAARCHRALNLGLRANSDATAVARKRFKLTPDDAA
jgi:hypothetical protein